MIEIKKEESIYVILRDRLDTLNADEANKKIDNELKEVDTDIIIDVTNLVYISSAGLQVVLKCAKMAKAHDLECYLKGAHGNVDEVFRISGFYSFLKALP